MYTDGRGANRPWLLENPDRSARSPGAPGSSSTPRRRGGSICATERSQRRCPTARWRAPVYVYPGIRQDVVAMPRASATPSTVTTPAGSGSSARPASGSRRQRIPPYVSVRVDLEKTREFRKLGPHRRHPPQLGRHIAEAMPLRKPGRATRWRSRSSRWASRSMRSTPSGAGSDRRVPGKAVEKTKLGAYAEEQPAGAW